MVYSYEEVSKATKEYFNGEELPTSVVVNKYLLRDGEDNLLEKTPDDKHLRLASELGRVEAKKFKNPYTKEQIYGWLKNYSKIILQGSPMYGIGNQSQFVTISNCYVVNCPEDSYGGIHKTDQQLTQISKRRGGVGTDISHIRPKNMPTRNSSRRSTGIIPFMERFSNSIREVGQDGRRGALMLTIDVHHPEVLDFAKVKLDPTKVTGANISIRLSDEFLNAVKENKEYELRWPVKSKTPKFSKMVSAREVWLAIIKCAWERAEPGLLFWDLILKDSPADCYANLGFRSESTNPCCFSSKNDIFVITDNGIKEIKNVNNKDKIWINETKEWVSNSGYFNAGKAKVFKVSFKNGEELFITGNHKLCTVSQKRDGTKAKFFEGELKELKDLTIGDRIYIHNTKVDGGFGNFGTYEEGLILGSMTGDGCLSFHEEGNQYPSTILDFWEDDLETGKLCESAFHKLGYKNSLISCDKTINKTRLRSELFTKNFVNKYEYNIWKFKSDSEINDFLFKASKDFIVGYLQTYFAADGTVSADDTNSNYCVQLTSINKNRLKQVQYLLNLFGIKSSLGLSRPEGISVIKGIEYNTQECWRLSLTGIDNIKTFIKEIGMPNKNKSAKLNHILNLEQEHNSKNSCYTTITMIEEIGEEEVGCIDVEKYHKFTANSVISGNSELPLCVLDSCRLLVLNLANFVQNKFQDSAKFNWEEFFEYAKIAQRLMDDVIDLEIECIDRIIDKVSNDPEEYNLRETELELWKTVREKCVNGRRTGLGITALGDALAALNLKYGSTDSIKVTENIFKLLKFGSYQSSVDMAKELGPFPIWNWELEKDNDFINRMKDEAFVLFEGENNNLGFNFNGYTLVEEIKKYGRRNIANLTCAPTGSISMLAQFADGVYGTTSGIEPAFMLSFVRRKKINPNDKGSRVDFIDQNGDKWQEFTVYHPAIKEWMRITGKTDIKESPWFGCCAEDLDWTKRVQLQAAAQRHIDHAISSTINLPENVTVEKVAEIYEDAWKAGLKGITVYRKNCRTGVLIDNKKAEEVKVITPTNAPKRPEELKCDIHHIKIKGDKEFFVLVGLIGKAPYEVLAGENGMLSKKAKHGIVTKVKRGQYKLVCDTGEALESVTEHSSDDEEAITRMVSTALRHGADITHICEQLSKVKGHLTSFSKSLARALKTYIKDGKKVSGASCPDCGGDLKYSEGCASCACGFSKCS